MPGVSIQLTDSLWVAYPATHTGKGKKLSGSVFYWATQKKILECKPVNTLTVLLNGHMSTY